MSLILLPVLGNLFSYSVPSSSLDMRVLFVLFLPSLMASCSDICGWYLWKACSFLKGIREAMDLGEMRGRGTGRSGRRESISQVVVYERRINKRKTKRHDTLCFKVKHTLSLWSKPVHQHNELTCRKWYNPLLSGRSETPRTWVSGILDGLGASPSLCLDIAQALVFSVVCCRIHWIPPSMTQQSHPHQTWSFHLHQSSHHVYVHCSCHKDHTACPWDEAQPWPPQNCLHPRISPNLEDKKTGGSPIPKHPNNSQICASFLVHMPSALRE